MRRLMLFLALLAAMMLVTSPVLAHQGGPHHGDKYWKNYYPNSWYKYCEPGGSQTYSKAKASKWCDKYYTEYHKKWNNGKQYYYVHVYYKWKTPDGQWHKQGYWYYCAYHKYDDPKAKRPFFKAWVSYKPTGKHYWESFYKGRGGGGLTYIGSATGNTGSTAQAEVRVPVPPGTKQGDFMLALLQADYGNVGGTLPSGWKLIKERLEGRDLSLHAYYKVAKATEPSSYTWKIVNAADHPLGGGTILSFRGVDQASPVFASTLNPETADPAKINCPSVNGPKGGMLVCAFAHDDPQPDIKVPASMTRVSNFIIRKDDAHAAAYEPITKAGATGIRTAKINPNLKGGKNDISMAISLRP